MKPNPHANSMTTGVACQTKIIRAAAITAIRAHFLTDAFDIEAILSQNAMTKNTAEIAPITNRNMLPLASGFTGMG